MRLCTSSRVLTKAQFEVSMSPSASLATLEEPALKEERSSALRIFKRVSRCCRAQPSSCEPSCESNVFRWSNSERSVICSAEVQGCPCQSAYPSLCPNKKKSELLSSIVNLAQFDEICLSLHSKNLKIRSLSKLRSR